MSIGKKGVSGPTFFTDLRVVCFLENLVSIFNFRIFFFGLDFDKEAEVSSQIK